MEREIRDLVMIAAKDHLAHFKKSFVNGGFTNNFLKPWQEPKRRTNFVPFTTKQRKRPQTKEQGYSAMSANKPTLVQSGKLKRSLYISWLDRNRIVIKSDVPYAAIHNYGLEGVAFGKHHFVMPKRQFIGYSGRLERRVMAKIKAKINTAVRNL